MLLRWMELPARTADLDAVDAITLRRSIRRGFSRREPSDEVVETIVRCGCSAPSSKDAQPWRIHLVRDPELLGAFADAMAALSATSRYVPIDPATGEGRTDDFPSSVVESSEVLRAVPVALFIENDGSFSGGRRNLEAHPESLREALVGYTFEVIGLGAAIQNMWIAAGALGLVGVFMGDILIVEEQIRDSLGMGGDLVGVLALGYSDEAPHAPRKLAPNRIRRHARL
jgi:nitroreductase